ncbi:MAG: class I tRNA ligase family protein, partial [Candidatus Diapherotrites archaeon]|nr:class I tRNA ligase family protein [Candidatus Diapherotrites archaeon]
DLVNGECFYHPKKKLEQLEEETYFFSLSKYQNYLLDLYKNHPEFVLPEEIRRDVTNRVSEGLKDFSISRTTFDWGIPFLGDPKHIIYVWFDALINYYTPIKDPKLKKYWPADLHLLGRDNTWFHTVYWPAMLKSCGIEHPKTVFTHGFFTVNGQKISKSLENSISPKLLVEKYGADSIRYYILRAVPFGIDGDFAELDLVNRHNNELANKLGNLVSRVSTLVEKYGLEQIKSSGQGSESLELDSKELVKKVKGYFEKYEFHRALNDIFAFVDKVNEFVQSKKPWETQDKKVLWEASNAIKDIAILLSPFMPSASEKISRVFNFELSLAALDSLLKVSKIKKADILFKKIEPKKSVSGSVVNKNKGSGGVAKEKIVSEKVVSNEVVTKNEAVNKVVNEKELVKKLASIINPVKVSFNDFAKLDLRVGRIIDAAPHPKADKLYLLNVDLGEEKPRIIVAGLRNFYSIEELSGKKAIFVTNLAPAVIRGVESNGMILAAVEGKDEKVVYLTPQKDLKEGSKVE